MARSVSEQSGLPKIEDLAALLNVLADTSRTTTSATPDLDSARELPAYLWLCDSQAVRDSLSAFRRRVSKSKRDELYFLVQLVFYFTRFLVSQAKPGCWIKAEPRVRRAAAKKARQLFYLISKEKADFADRDATQSLLRMLDAYAMEQDVYSLTRKERLDSTTEQRRFIVGLSFSMQGQFAIVPPSVLKPLGQLIDYYPDDRRWTSLISEGKEKRRRHMMADASRKGYTANFLLYRNLLAPPQEK